LQQDLFSLVSEFIKKKGENRLYDLLATPKWKVPNPDLNGKYKTLLCKLPSLLWLKAFLLILLLQFHYPISTTPVVVAVVAASFSYCSN
jgi:hypothetical protein